MNPHTPGSSPGWNPEDRYFDISDTATAQEQDLLSKYGKVFFYEYTVILKSNGSIVGQGHLQVKNQTIQDPGAFHYWDDTFITNAYVPGRGHFGKLYYYHETNLLPGQWPFTEYFHNGVFPDVWCDSREVDYQFEYPNEESLIGSPLHKINLDMAAGVGLWMTSGHHISIRN